MRRVGLAGAVGAAALWTVLSTVHGQAEPPIGAVARSCADDNPYFAVTRLTAPSDDDAAVVAFYDTPDDDRRQQLALARRGDVGAAYGLAYDWRRGHLYVAAHHRVGAALGPGGPGQVYRVDLHTGRLDRFARMSAGPDRHDSADGAAWVGASALGDIEVDPRSDQLLVMNLHDRRIHRFRLPDGLPLGSFAHGGHGATWAERARPFGLGIDGPWLFHGVVELPPAQGGTAEVHLYRSHADGSGMTESAAFDLRYPRAPAWGGWTPRGDGAAAEPILADIAFRTDGTPIVGLRDRRADAAGAVGSGDVLPLAPQGAGWRLVTEPEHYRDRFTMDESLLGGLAVFPGVDLLVAPATAPIVPGTSGGVWFDMATGADVTRETVAMGAPGGVDAFGSLGDVEVLCGPPGAPTLAPTPTPTATPTSTPTPAPAYLPLALRERCPDLWVDAVLVLDMSTSMRDLTADGVRKHEAAVAAARAFLQLLDLAGTGSPAGDRAALVGFNATATILHDLTGDRGALEARLATLGSGLAPGSRIDLAIEAGTAALEAGREDGRVAALVILTDGLATGVPPAEDGRTETTVLRAADGARAGGARVYAIGFGRPAELDSALLRAVAGDASRYRETPDAAALAEIYAQLAALVRCPPGRHPWGPPWP